MSDSNSNSSGLYFIDEVAVWFVVLLCKIIIHLLVFASCDVNLNVTETKQYVTTEDYPNFYNNFQDCEFNFMAPAGRKFIVLFEDFDLEQGNYLYFHKLT